MKLGFDLGLQPWSFMATPTWFVSHTHLDHIAALPVYVSRRRMMKMEPPTIYLPAVRQSTTSSVCSRAFSGWTGAGLPVDAHRAGAGPGDRAVARAGRHRPADPAHHPLAGLPRLGARKKLKPEYQGFTATRSATCGSPASRFPARSACPGVAYLGDTAPAGLDVCPDVYRAEILILEMTFVSPQERPDRIHKYGHMHLDDILQRADRFENDWIIASHFSTRLPPPVIERIIRQRLPQSLKDRLKVWL